VIEHRRFVNARAELKRIRADYTRANERAASVRGEKGHILRIVQQEIATPLGTLRTQLDHARTRASEMMAGSTLLDSINSASQQAERIDFGVSSLAEIQTLDDRSRAVLLGTINVNTVVMEAAATAREAAEKKAIRISIPAPSKVSLARGDATILRKVVSALVFQAIEVSPTGAAVSLSFYQTEDRVLITISDEGPGAVSADQAHILAQSGDSRPSFGGAAANPSPVNLAMAHNLVKAMQGWLWSQSEPGRGTTHVLELPLPSQAEDVPFAASR
jgi:signal transduction histidine kinase